MEEYTFVTDRGANVVAALSNFNRISCAAHILNNVLAKGTKKSKQFCKFVEESKSLVRFFKKSTNLQKTLNTTLKSACETRWNSVIAMLKSIRDNYSEESGILLSRNELKKIENISIDMLNQAIDFLEAFNYASEELQQSHNPTLYLCFPYYLNLSEKCNLNGSELPMIKEFKENVGHFLKQVWEP